MLKLLTGGGLGRRLDGALCGRGLDGGLGVSGAFGVSGATDAENVSVLVPAKPGFAAALDGTRLAGTFLMSIEGFAPVP